MFILLGRTSRICAGRGSKPSNATWTTPTLTAKLCLLLVARIINLGNLAFRASHVAVLASCSAITMCTVLHIFLSFIHVGSIVCAQAAPASPSSIVSVLLRQFFRCFTLTQDSKSTHYGSMITLTLGEGAPNGPVSHREPMACSDIHQSITGWASYKPGKGTAV